jgi:hypothetical protein
MSMITLLAACYNSASGEFVCTECFPFTERSPIVDMQNLLHNRQQFPPEELARYLGQHVAWSPDGTRIIASDADLLELDAKIATAGYNPAEILVSAVPAEEVILGGGGAIE